MKSVDIYIRFSNQNVKLAKAATLHREGNLIYKDEGGNFKAHVITVLKFTLLTLVSPLICLARAVRSVAFACTGQFSRAGREFIGGLAAPLVTSTCLAGSLASSAICLLSGGQVSFYAFMRKTYAHFESWINEINLKSFDLPSYSQRVSGTLNVIGTSKGLQNHVWTTAPCMQPILEKGISPVGGLLDVERMRKIFPLAKINGMRVENGQIVIQSEYVKENIHHVTYHGACEHAKVSTTCCCCYHIEAVYDRILCCEVGQGNCSSLASPTDTSGICFCTACGIGVCCCTEKIDNAHLSVAAACCLSPC